MVCIPPTKRGTHRPPERWTHSIRELHSAVDINLEWHIESKCKHWRRRRRWQIVKNKRNETRPTEMCTDLKIVVAPTTYLGSAVACFAANIEKSRLQIRTKKLRSIVKKIFCVVKWRDFFAPSTHSRKRYHFHIRHTTMNNWAIRG